MLTNDGSNEGVGLQVLGDIANGYQFILEYAYKKEVKSSKKPTSEEYRDQKNYRVFAKLAKAGSLVLHLSSNSDVDIYGTAKIEVGLNAFDKLIGEISNKEDYVSTLAKFKGHTISGLKRLLEVVIENNVTLKHNWFTPNKIIHPSVSITPDKAEKIYSILNERSELTDEIVELVGVFNKVDVNNKSWRLTDDKSDMPLNGTCDDPDLLSGITIDTVKYTVVCREIKEEMTISAKAKTRYVLLAVHEA